jgi:hypothetical protein
VLGAIPPACRRGVDRWPSTSTRGDDVVVALREWRPRRRARHFVPACTLLRAGDVTYRFELSVLTAGGWSDWVGAATLGPARLTPVATSVAGLASDVDLFVAEAPAARVRLRLRLPLRDATALRRPALITLSACDVAGAIAAPGRPLARDAVELVGATNEAVAAVAPRGARRNSALTVGAGSVRTVPVLSQMRAPAALAPRICSPASVAMVLRAWNVRVALAALAAEMYHPALDLYGVWPAAIRAAARRGIAGYLLRFPDWDSASWCLRRGLPVIASVRYRAGELTGAAIVETPGHLIVLVAEEGDDVIVNDPAAPTNAAVRRRYPKSELTRVWLERAGVGYVLFRPKYIGAAR